jgi:hypothetical protein
VAGGPTTSPDGKLLARELEPCLGLLDAERSERSPLGAEIPLDLRLAVSYFTLGLDQHTLC